jgi:hypothetical protein
VTIFLFIWVPYKNEAELEIISFLACNHDDLDQFHATMEWHFQPIFSGEGGGFPRNGNPGTKKWERVATGVAAG